MENPLISIIIPLYNKEEFIENTINSILIQNYNNFELIIINDGSNDNSKQVVSAILDSRIILINQENKGVSYSRNRAAFEANGDFFLFLDADDYLLPYGLQTLIDLYRIYPDIEVFTGNFYTDNKGIKKKECKYNFNGILDNPFKLIWEDIWNIRLGCFLIKKEAYIKTNGFVSYILIGEDTFFTNFILNTFKIAYINTPIMVYSISSNSLSVQKQHFSKHIDSFFSLSSENKYQNKQEAYLLFKHFFRGFIRIDFCFSIQLIYKFYKFLPFMISVFFYKTFLKFNKNLTQINTIKNNRQIKNKN